MSYAPFYGKIVISNFIRVHLSHAYISQFVSLEERKIQSYLKSSYDYLVLQQQKNTLLFLPKTLHTLF